MKSSKEEKPGKSIKYILKQDNKMGKLRKRDRQKGMQRKHTLAILQNFLIYNWDLQATESKKTGDRRNGTR